MVELEKFLKWGYMMGVIARFLGMLVLAISHVLSGMALLYLGYLSATGTVFVEKMRFLAGHKYLVNSSVLIVFSILQFTFAIRKVKIQRLHSAGWQNEEIELGTFSGAGTGRV